MAERSKYQQKIIKNYYQNREAISLQRVQELVTLSKEYGILTPFTAFLAREDQPIDLISRVPLMSE